MKTLLLLLFMLTLTNPAQSADAPTGASLAWTSTDPLVVHARELISRGELSRAAEILHSTSSAGKADPAAIDETLEIIRRIRLLYPLDAEQLVAKLSPQIRDIKPLDIERWRRSGEVQFRILDGRPAYFSREPANLVRFSPQLQDTAAQIVGDETNPLAKARKIFHWVDANIRYNAEEEYCIIPSLSEHAPVDEF